MPCSRNVEHLAPVGTEDAPDPRDVLKVEERGVVLALRDTYMPGLDGSDAVMFATLLADLFPNVQVPMIFESYGSQGSKMQMNEQVSNLEEIPVLPKAPGEPSGDNMEGMWIALCYRLFSSSSKANGLGLLRDYRIARHGKCVLVLP